MDLILAPENMSMAWKRVKSNDGSPGVDNLHIEDFPDYMHKKWSKVKQALLLGYYVPSPVLRVEIPKKSGGKRILGIPTVLDRVIQQGISQILMPIFDPEFSNSSFGYRPNRSAQGAIKQVRNHVEKKYRFALDLDLEKFFDTVNHDILMNLVSKKISDKRVLKLIGKYLRAGIQDKTGNRQQTLVGTPQGGPLSPLLSNILLDKLDKKLEEEKIPFARYADDMIILAKSLSKGKQIFVDVTEYLENKLKLKVNKEKSKVAQIKECTFLGFIIKGTKIRWSERSYNDFIYRLKKLTSRSWGVSMSYRLRKLKEYVSGWMNYYGISKFYKGIEGLDEWIRRRIRMCYWKRWRHGRTKYRELTKLGVSSNYARMMAGSSKSYWHLSKSYSTQCGMSNKWLEEQGLVNIKALWCKAQGDIN